MKLTDYLKKLIRDYFVIFAVIVISITLLRQIFAPNEYLELKDIYNYMICALVGDLASLVFYSSKEISEKKMGKRIIIHFFILEIALLVLANAVGWVSGIVDTVFLAVQIALIYMIARLLLWVGDQKSASNINERLKAIKEQSSDEYENE